MSYLMYALYTCQVDTLSKTYKMMSNFTVLLIVWSYLLIWLYLVENIITYRTKRAGKIFIARIRALLPNSCPTGTRLVKD